MKISKKVIKYMDEYDWIKFYKIIVIMMILYITSIIVRVYLRLNHNFKIKQSSLDINWLTKYRVKNTKYKELPPPIDQSLPVPDGFKGHCIGYNLRPGNKIFDDIPMKNNHDNDHKITRMVRGWWPEFSWWMDKDNKSRGKVYTRLVQDITRIGYNDNGEILSVICPQRGTCQFYGCVKFEFTVEQCKGWINEKNLTCHGFLKTHVKLWLDEGSKDNSIIKYIRKKYPSDYYFPLGKSKAIIIDVYTNEGSGYQEFRDFNNIEPNLHPEASLCARILPCTIGDVRSTGNQKADKINNLLKKIVLLEGSNIIQKGNLVYWDLYLLKPEVINKKEYMNHVNVLKDSIENCRENCESVTINEYGEDTTIISNIIYDIIKYII